MLFNLEVESNKPYNLVKGRSRTRLTFVQTDDRKMCQIGVAEDLRDFSGITRVAEP